MPYLPDHLFKALYAVLVAFGAKEKGVTPFTRYWNAVGPLEDYASMARTRHEQILVELLRRQLEGNLRKAAPYDEVHPDARGVGEFLQSPPRRRRYRWR